VKTGKTRISAGFSLVEIMVGMTIGLITILVVLQVTQVAEARKRASTSGTDATVNAALGLYTIERDGKSAGFGFTTVLTSVGCQINGRYGTANPLTFNLVPVVITDDETGRPDKIQFFASNKQDGITLPTRIANDHAKAGDVFYVESDLGIEPGDMMVAVPSALSAGTPCTLFQVAGAGTPSQQNQVPHALEGTPWNQAGANIVLPNGGYRTGDYLINLGSFNDHTYSITDRNFLRLTAYEMATNTSSEQDLYPDVVQLQAVYGKDTNADSIVDQWNATPPVDAVQWQQIRAVRVALVARGRDREPEVVTLDGAAAASTCDSATPHPAALCWRPNPAGNGVKIDVNINNANPDWQRFRYRVVETSIPLRNVIWKQ
jgi:type IV pilus assembly protein PilW